MARVNEFKANGGVFSDSMEAIHALESYLDDIKKTDDRSSSKLERDRRYRANIAGIKDTFASVINGEIEAWKEAGLDTSFAQVTQEMEREKYTHEVMFRHPVYEHVWITDNDGRDVGEEMLPFLVYWIEYSKERRKVKVSVNKLEVKLNLPAFSTTVKKAREDVELIKSEAQFVGRVDANSEETRKKLNAALAAFCQQNKLTLETTEEAGPVIDDLDALKNAEFGEDLEETEIIDVVDIDEDSEEEIAKGKGKDDNSSPLESALFAGSQPKKKGKKRK